MPRVPRIRARLLFPLLVVCSIASQACDTQVPARVLYVGDSVLVQATEEIVRATLARRRAYSTIPQAVGGSGLKDLDGYWLPRLDALRAAGVEWDAVVVHAGINDAWSATFELDAFDYAERVDALMESLGDVPVIWFDVPEDAPLPPERLAVVNTEIRSASARWPNLTVLWSTAIFDGCLGCYRSDGIHQTEGGQERLAAVVLEQLDFVFPSSPNPPDDDTPPEDEVPADDEPPPEDDDPRDDGNPADEETPSDDEVPADDEAPPDQANPSGDAASSDA